MKAYQIRPANADDIPFIYASWLNSYKTDSHIGLSTTKTVFMDNYKLVIDHILAAADSHVLVACKEDEPHVIFGYLVSQPNILHYVFVKKAFWNLGIARDLFNTAFFIPNEPVQVTHITRDITSLPSNCTYNPYILFNKGTTNA